MPVSVAGYRCAASSGSRKPPWVAISSFNRRLIRVRLRGKHAAAISAALKLGVSATQAEGLTLCWSARNVAKGLVKRAEHMGDQTRLHLTFNHHNSTLVTNVRAALRGGDIVKIRPRRPFYSDAAGNRLA